MNIQQERPFPSQQQEVLITQSMGKVGDGVSPISTLDLQRQNPYYLIVLFVIVLSLIGLSVWVVFTRYAPVYQSPAQLSTQDTANGKDVLVDLEVPLPTMTTYTHPVHTEVSFNMPEEASIIILEDFELDQPGVLEILVQYQEMNVYVRMLSGVGGIPRLYDAPYMIISGTDAEGVGREISLDQDTRQISAKYFSFFQGGQQHGGTLGSLGFLAQFPEKSQHVYQPIADAMAASVMQIYLNSTPSWGKAFIAFNDVQDTVLSGIRRDGTQFTIFSGSVDVWLAQVNSVGTHIAFFATNQITGNVELFIYDLLQESFVVANLDVPAQDALWLSEGEFAYYYSVAGSSEYESFSVDTLERKPITELQFEEARRLMVR